MRRLFIPLTLIILLSALLGTPSPAAMQGNDSTCSVVAQNAIDLTGQLCDGTGRNEACYGHALIDAELAPTTAARFVEAGDVAEVASLRSLRLGGMDATSGLWGVALMRLQADLVDQFASGDVTLVAFGNVTLENISGSATIRVESLAAGNLNIRQRPVPGAFVLGTLSSGQQVTATGRLADESWLQVVDPVTGDTGWVAAAYLSAVEGHLDDLPVVSADADYYRPMQAFMLDSSARQGACTEAPNAVLIQTPEGAGMVRFKVNEVGIRLGSTIFFYIDGGQMTVGLLEGHAQIQSDGVVQTLFPGTQVNVALGPDGLAAGPPTLPEPYDASYIGVLPVNLLEREFDVAEPLTPAQITQMTDDLAAQYQDSNANAAPASPVHDDVPVAVESTGEHTSTEDSAASTATVVPPTPAPDNNGQGNNDQGDNGNGNNGNGNNGHGNNGHGNNGHGNNGNHYGQIKHGG